MQPSLITLPCTPFLDTDLVLCVSSLACAFVPSFFLLPATHCASAERLRMCGARIVQCPEAVGFHWHTAFSLDQLEGDLRRVCHRSLPTFPSLCMICSLYLLVNLWRASWRRTGVGSLLGSLCCLVRSHVDESRTRVPTQTLCPAEDIQHSCWMSLVLALLRWPLKRKKNMCPRYPACWVPPQERERGRNAVRFFLKHPASWHVRLMLQLTPFHWFLWGLLTLGGLVSEASLRPLLQTLVAKGHIQVAGALLVPVYNWHYMLAMDKELERLRAKG